MRSAFLTILLVGAVFTADARILPGFRLDKLADTEGIATSLVTDRGGRIYYSASGGEIFRLRGSASELVATVAASSGGNRGLLGIAFLDDNTLVAHYSTPDGTADVLGRVDIRTGEVAEVARFICDDGRECSTEHHGGNPIVLTDGSVLVPLGDFGGSIRAQSPDYPAGKIFRITPLAQSEVFASGFRNPFDIVFEEATGLLIVPDNGPELEDEINFVSKGDNGGWPLTMGNQPPIGGLLPPVFVFNDTVAPTGTTLMPRLGPVRRALLVGSFVRHSIFFFPDFDSRPLRSPIEIIAEETAPVIDVIGEKNGTILFSALDGIFRLTPPIRGDADGNLRVDAGDLEALSREILDGDGTRTIDAQGGSYPGSWGADVNEDGEIDSRDLVALARLIGGRRRAVYPGQGR